MKPFRLLLFLTGFFVACGGDTGNSSEQRLRTENFELRQQVDSLKNLISKLNPKAESDTLLKLPDVKSERTGDEFAGKHSLTLQWISWDEPGTVTVVPAGNGWYTISGKQARNENYVKITGRIKPVNKQELEFDGEIETRITSINSGEPCLKTGKKIFKATGTRKYWRLQDMLNCDSLTTDYVDIYF